MSTTISIAQLYATLEEVAQQLKNASGNDTFISRADIDALLLPIYASDLERAYLLGALLSIAEITEPANGGRITRQDIDRAVQVVREKVIPAFHLLLGDLSVAAELSLATLGIDYINMARTLKVYTQKQNTTSAQELVLQLRQLTQNLYFNGFQQNNTSIVTDFAPFRATELNGTTFLQALETAGNPDWEGVAFRFGNEVENDGTTIEDFWATFRTLQNEGAERERALAVERLWRSRLSQSRHIRFDNSSLETTHFVVAGLNGSQEVVFMLIQYIWT